MEYVKHKYSKRVYQVMEDHGSEHPYLSCFPYVRYCGQSTLKKFFIPSLGPVQDSEITIPQEMRWEERELLRREPIRVRAPVSGRRARVQKLTPEITKEYTLLDLCGEIGMDPSKARKLLRAKGKRPPNGTWKWPNKKDARSIKKFLKNL